MKVKNLLIATAILAAGGYLSAEACTNLIAGKKATTDGSVMITYAADSHNLYGQLTHTPRAKHAKGEMRKIVEWDTQKPWCEIPQPEENYSVIVNMN